MTRWWLNLNASLWYLPALLVAVFLTPAFGLVVLDRHLPYEWE